MIRESRGRQILDDPEQIRILFEYLFGKLTLGGQFVQEPVGWTSYVIVVA